VCCNCADAHAYGPDDEINFSVQRLMVSLRRLWALSDETATGK